MNSNDLVKNEFAINGTLKLHLSQCRNRAKYKKKKCHTLNMLRFYTSYFSYELIVGLSANT